MFFLKLLKNLIRKFWFKNLIRFIFEKRAFEEVVIVAGQEYQGLGHGQVQQQGPGQEDNNIMADKTI